MAETMMQGSAGVGAPSAAAGRAQTQTQLDEQIALESKKATLRALQEENAGGPAQAPEVPQVPAPPGMSKTTVVIQKDGNTTVLENPTDAQLAQVGIGARGSEWNPFNRMESRQVGVLATFAMFSVVAITWIVVHYLRGARNAAAAQDTSALDRRMARVENAIETVAVEVERMSEAQRYTTKILSEGAAQGVNVPEIMNAALKNRGGA